VIWSLLLYIVQCANTRDKLASQWRPGHPYSYWWLIWLLLPGYKFTWPASTSILVLENSLMVFMVMVFCKTFLWIKQLILEQKNCRDVLMSRNLMVLPCIPTSRNNWPNRAVEWLLKAQLRPQLRDNTMKCWCFLVEDAVCALPQRPKYYALSLTVRFIWVYEFRSRSRNSSSH
jgi:hypothetical protein